MLLRRVMATAATALLAVTTLGACADDAATTQGDLNDGKPIEVWTRSAPDPAATYRKVFAAFTQKTGIKVDYKPVVEFDTQLQARANQKDLPDVLINDAGSLGAYQSQGFLLPIDQASIAGQGQIPQATWDQGRGTDGKMYAVPWSRQANVLVVRKDWREKLGLPVPRTWDDLTALATAFATRDPDGDGKADTFGMAVPGTADSGYIARWGVPFIWSAGGDLLARQNGKYTSVVDSAGTRAGIAYVQKLFCTNGVVVPGSINNTTSDTPFFQQGRAGMYLTGAYNLSAFDAALGRQNVEVDAVPAGPAGSVTFAEGEDIYFGASSKEHAKQVALAEFLISDQAQTIGMDSPAQGGKGPFTPVVRLPVNAQLNAATVYADPRWQVVADAYAKGSKPFPWAIDFIPFRQALADGMNRVAATCGSDVGAAVQQIDQKFRGEIASQGIG